MIVIMEKKENNFCEICRNHNFKNNLKYIVIDLRNKNDSPIKDSIANEGTLLFINNEIISQDMLNKNNVAEILCQQINNLNQIGKDESSNNKMHIVLMTNETDSFDEFEYNYQETQENAKKIKIPNILSSAIASVKKKLDEPKYKKELKPEKLQRIKSLLKQYELIKNIILTLIEKIILISHMFMADINQSMIYV